MIQAALADDFLTVIKIRFPTLAFDSRIDWTESSPVVISIITLSSTPTGETIQDN